MVVAPRLWSMDMSSAVDANRGPDDGGLKRGGGNVLHTPQLDPPGKT